MPITVKAAREYLLSQGFNLVTQKGQPAPKPTNKKHTEISRRKVGNPNAVTSISGKSVHMKGVNPHTQAPVTFYMPAKGMLSPDVAQRLQQITGLTFPEC